MFLGSPPDRPSDIPPQRHDCPLCGGSEPMPAIRLDDIRRIVREEIERASPKVKTAQQFLEQGNWSASGVWVSNASGRWIVGWEDCLKAHGVHPEQK